jgi:hypothetical protein
MPIKRDIGGLSQHDNTGFGSVIAGPLLLRPIDELSKMNRFPPTPVPPAPMAGTLGSIVEPLLRDNLRIWILFFGRTTNGSPRSMSFFVRRMMLPLKSTRTPRALVIGSAFVGTSSRNASNVWHVGCFRKLRMG